MWGKLEQQKLQDTAFARDQNDRLQVADEASRLAVWSTKEAVFSPLYGERGFAVDLHSDFGMFVCG